MIHIPTNDTYYRKDTGEIVFVVGVTKVKNSFLVICRTVEDISKNDFDRYDVKFYQMLKSIPLDKWNDTNFKTNEKTFKKLLNREAWIEMYNNKLLTGNVYGKSN